MNEFSNIMRAEMARTGNYGYDYYNDEEAVRCEICGEITDMFYINKDGEVVGCDNCITTKYADEM